MNITNNIIGGKTVLTLIGRLDATAASTLQNVLIPEFDTTKHVELDFAELVYVSSAGLGVLLQSERTAKSKEAVLTIANVSEEVMEILEMTGFTSILKIV